MKLSQSKQDLKGILKSGLTEQEKLLSKFQSDSLTSKKDTNKFLII
jgi:hypothetical protein